jgi:hypothetical protein
VLVSAAAAVGIGLNARAGVGKDCGTAIGTFPTEPHKRKIHTPPAPGFMVTQIAPHTFRFEWTLAGSTAHCRPAWIVLRVFGPSSPPGFGPSPLKVIGSSGTYVMNVQPSLGVTSASATSFGENWSESRVTMVRIRY